MKPPAYSPAYAQEAPRLELLIALYSQWAKEYKQAGRTTAARRAEKSVEHFKACLARLREPEGGA